uniref:Zinc finger protein 654 n=1 Tax=Salarias fasciatus TaxID=181472 RepID=A0A672GCX5_SALFA
MADNESDLETDGLELALDTLCIRHCSNEAALNSKEYCSAFCELVEEYTGQWHVPLPQLKVLRAALLNFTKATAAFPDDCQHIHYVLSSMALSFFELMLFFSKEEFVEEPLKNILDSFQECHIRLLRHRNIYLQHVKQIIKAGGPWENPVLQGILKEAKLSPTEIEDYLSSELTVFFELRVRYLQACERMQEAMALAKSCLESRETGKHLYFHQAYLTCLYKASLYENLHKEVGDKDGRDAVEIICNTESVEKDELLLSLCKTFLTQQLHNGDMYYIWDLVFIWSRLHLRAHPSREGFLAECLQLASSATNVRAIFPFIKLVTSEVEGVQVCVELCARALQLCEMQADAVTQSLVYKTIAFLLPHDLEICRACALLVFCQERSLEAYRTVCSLYMHPDQEPHPHNDSVRTSVRFHILQMLKERLCFDPEFWNLLTLRNHCLELINDQVMKAAVLNEMKEEEEKEYNEELVTNSSVNSSCTHDTSHNHTEEASAPQNPPQVETNQEAETKDRVLRTQQYAHITYHCNFCQKDYKGLNVLRHVLSHLKSRRLKCILCGKRFQQPLVAKKHVLEHIEAMSKEKPPDEKPCSEEKPAANGTTCTVKNHTPSVEEEQKPVIKVKVSSLKREERIIRNLRTLIKKTSVLHKKCKNPDTNLFRNIDFTDEQVVIADGLVIVRAPTVVKEEEEEHEEDGEENSLPTRKNGYDLDVTYHLCPSDSCDRVFLRISSTLTKHAIKCHIDEDKVLEKTFVWAKHKCTLCYRYEIQFLQHYKDHMKLHNAPLQHFCYHLGCEQRFASQQELKDHAVTHQPFRPRCTFADCGKIFASLQCLHDHEWRHYIPAPQKEELDVGSRQNSQSDEAPWKQRVKVEQLWLQNKKGPTESPAIKTEPSDMEYYSEAVKTERQDSEISAQERSPIPFQPDNCLEKTDDHENTHASKTTINGHEAVTTNVPHQSVSAPLAHSSSTTPTKKARKKTPELDPINIRDLEDLSTLAEGISQNIAEPHITEHKSFKPEDPSYATFVKAPFTRPPPSTYLDESLLSMRKRRTDDEPPPKKYLSWSQRKKKEPDPVQPPQGAEESPEKKVRQRCEKCLDSFSSSEELQKHQSQNKCSSFFGFDSDDESKCV